MPIHFIYFWWLFKTKIQNAIIKTNLLTNRQDDSNKKKGKENISFIHKELHLLKNINNDTTLLNNVHRVKREVEK